MHSGILIRKIAAVRQQQCCCFEYFSNLLKCSSETFCSTFVSINNVCARIFLFSLIVVAAGAEQAEEAGRAGNDTRSCCDSLNLESGGMGDFYQVSITHHHRSH